MRGIADRLLAGGTPELCTGRDSGASGHPAGRVGARPAAGARHTACTGSQRVPVTPLLGAE